MTTPSFPPPKGDAVLRFLRLKEEHRAPVREECEECGREMTMEDEEEGYCLRCGLKPLAWDCRHQWVEGDFTDENGQHWSLKCRTCGAMEEEGS